MKAAVFYAPGQVRLEEINIPDIGPDEVLVKVRVALTCGTDRKTYLRGHHLFNPPFVFGHPIFLWSNFPFYKVFL